MKSAWRPRCLGGLDFWNTCGWTPRSVVIALAVLGGCAQSVDVEPVGDYSSWYSTEVTGNAPGHSNSRRVIYVNPTARDAPSLSPGYPEGSIFVKEVYELSGELRYTAFMRRIGALEDEGGWLYTEDSGAGTEEKYFPFCWSRCHVAAPYNGAWYDYRAR
jgi:hypothetical protein